MTAPSIIIGVDARGTTIVLVDDLRSCVDGRTADVARTSAAGVDLLDRHRDRRLDELWLDHDLGEDDTIWPVVEVLERAAFEKRPSDVGVINVQSANPAGASEWVARWVTAALSSSHRLRPDLPRFEPAEPFVGHGTKGSDHPRSVGPGSRRSGHQREPVGGRPV